MTVIIKGDSGVNLDYSTGGRITGDFSNATVANRVLFQTSTVNGNTSVGAVPNGTSTQANLRVYSAPDPTNASFADMVMEGTAAIFRSDKAGTGTYLPMVFQTGGSESLRLSKDYKTVILSGGSTSANGTGITFPASQSASTDANTLDDYEEGTFTPTWGSGVTSPVYAAQIGNYTKIGRMVYFSLRIALSGGTANATTALVTGLPFASSNSNSFTSGGVFAYNNGTVGAALPTVFIGTGSSQIEFYTVAGSQLAGTGFTAIGSSNIYLAGCYMANA